MDLQVKYHYYTMCTLQDMDQYQELNQSVTDILTNVKLYVTSTFVMGHKKFENPLNLTEYIKTTVSLKLFDLWPKQ